MADELQLHYVVPGAPDVVMAEWRRNPPAPLHGFRVADEAFNSIVYECHYYDWIWKIMWWVTFGIAYLLRSFARSVWRVTVRFDAEGDGATKVTVLGKADEHTRASFGELAARNGGPVGLRVGV